MDAVGKSNSGILVRQTRGTLFVRVRTTVVAMAVLLEMGLSKHARVVTQSANQVHKLGFDTMCL